MTYVRESGRSAASRRARRRAAITLSVLSALLVVAFVIALSYHQGWFGAQSAPAPTNNVAKTCSKVQPALPTDVVVNVYNATERNGLARTTAKALTDQGFRTASVTNDPLQKTIPGVGEVRFGKTGVEEATAVLLRVPGARGVRDTRADASVDLVLGEAFKAVAVVKGAPKACP
ncbi:MAG: LytR C-terminal domain-containing protein [Austwickia sp.]|jgi:uncharacterized membrane protein (DUF485 family)|nr:LytR C-terminal domain-containing protein [Austwickia sp.]MBK8437743.1 LytR C-terminal domain-containing protein [Austwickia sp.]MBK9100052.1 LytR C-terminal domain-containing protein [Austwickia sp.]